jgi:hypothetical protein
VAAFLRSAADNTVKILRRPRLATAACLFAAAKKVDTSVDVVSFVIFIKY